MDVDEYRDPIVTAFDLPNVDQGYAFFYDETNNVRRLHLRDGKLNIDRPECFVLGGVVRRAPAPPVDLNSLRRALRLPADGPEIKLKQLGRGAFLDHLKSERVANFVAWLEREQFLIHYQVVDILYWSLVDIVDSILAASKGRALLPFGWQLKASLYALLESDRDRTVELLARYSYPDLGARGPAFLDDLLEWLEESDRLLDHFERHMLKGFLQIGRSAEPLLFLDRETPNVLVEEFGSFFLNRIALFKHSSHVLDEEPYVEAHLAGVGLTKGGAPFRNYRFSNSRAEAGIQLSDVVVGLLGKMFTYLNRTPMAEIARDLDSLAGPQRACLQRLLRLLDRSTDECPAFAHYVLSLSTQQRAGLLVARSS